MTKFVIELSVTEKVLNYYYVKYFTQIIINKKTKGIQLKLMNITYNTLPEVEQGTLKVTSIVSKKLP